MIGWPATERNNGKKQNSILYISTEERLGQLFAVYGCNGTEFSYVIFTEQQSEFYNGRMAKRQRKNGNGMAETGNNAALLGTDGGTVHQRPRTENRNGRIKQGEQKAHYDHNQTNTAAVALTENRTQPTDNTAQ